jgi:hypothetical protein
VNRDIEFACLFVPYHFKTLVKTGHTHLAPAKITLVAILAFQTWLWVFGIGADKVKNSVCLVFGRGKSSHLLSLRKNQLPFIYWTKMYVMGEYLTQVVQTNLGGWTKFFFFFVCFLSNVWFKPSKS